MTRAELVKAFNETDEMFAETKIYKEILADIEKDLAAGQYGERIILFNGAFELSKHFMFAVMCKAFCDENDNIR